jgi:Flp pilus assembly protein TadD
MFGAILAVFAVIASAAPASQDPSVSLTAADAAMEAGRFADAAHQYEAWLASHPAAEEVLFALGVCYLQLGRADNAVDVLRRYVKLVPRAANGHALLGIALLDDVAVAEAKAELETALSLDPAQTNAREALARIHLVEGNPATAVALLRPMVSEDRGGGDIRE